MNGPYYLLETGVSLLTLWIVCFGIAMIVGKHHHFASWSKSKIVQLLQYVWRKWKKEIIFFAVGFLTAMMIFYKP
jgi:hypothetical protein